MIRYTKWLKYACWMHAVKLLVSCPSETQSESLSKNGMMLILFEIIMIIEERSRSSEGFPASEWEAKEF
ncbi:hypothetical protein CEXT_86421 [Caerostris extrusa]|uniref:Uncharacterized protein n=1 Tax=Caerostris extrusa TaxID=172846 RepID=A0AAV4V3I8_CAEEX|nr:hypothetical protein CEXT_86421 [Caerostris extrusa]